MRPRLKDTAWQRRGCDLLVAYDVREGLLLPDPDGTVELLLGLLASGGRTVPELAGELGLAVADVADAVASAVPVLVRWMSQVDYRPLWEDIVRALAVPWAREAAPALLAEFREGDPSQDPPDTSPRWVVGLALSAIADPSLADDLIELAADRRWGEARGMIIQELGKTADRARSTCS